MDDVAKSTQLRFIKGLPFSTISSQRQPHQNPINSALVDLQHPIKSLLDVLVTAFALCEYI